MRERAFYAASSRAPGRHGARASDRRHRQIAIAAPQGESAMDATPIAIRPLGHALSRRSLLGTMAAGSLLGGALRFVPPVAAQYEEATPAATGPAPAHRISIGQIDVVVLDDGLFPGPANLFAINAPPAALEEAVTAAGLDPAAILVGVHPLLVETDGQRVLLDTGSGPFAAAPGTLPAALAAEGIAPEEIDVVLITHLHADHFGGGLNAEGGHAFPNARYLINAAEHEFWAADPSLNELVIPDEFKQLFRQSISDFLAAMGGTLEQIAPGDEIAPGVVAVDAKGHTPGQLAVEVTSDGEGLLHIVDVAHIPEIHLEHPDWFLAADNWPAWTAVTRQTLFDRAADENLLVATYHFPFPGLGRVTKDEIGWTWTAEG
jgi:glyoxylase-like metal-dependent hydrolase (beta-lactamase superfamily II)